MVLFKVFAPRQELDEPFSSVYEISELLGHFLVHHSNETFELTALTARVTVSFNKPLISRTKKGKFFIAEYEVFV